MFFDSYHLLHKPVDVWCWRKTVEILTDALKIVCGFTCMAKFSQYLSPCSPVTLRYIVWYLQGDAPLWYCGMTHGSNRCCTLIRIISTSTVSNKPFRASVTTVKTPVSNTDCKIIPFTQLGVICYLIMYVFVCAGTSLSPFSHMSPP